MIDNKYLKIQRLNEPSSSPSYQQAFKKFRFDKQTLKLQRRIVSRLSQQCQRDPRAFGSKFGQSQEDMEKHILGRLSQECQGDTRVFLSKFGKTLNMESAQSKSKWPERRNQFIHHQLKKNKEFIKSPNQTCSSKNINQYIQAINSPEVNLVPQNNTAGMTHFYHQRRIVTQQRNLLWLQDSEANPPYDKIVQTVQVLANFGKGTIFLGVDDKGIITGFPMNEQQKNSFVDNFQRQWVSKVKSGADDSQNLIVSVKFEGVKKALISSMQGETQLVDRYVAIITVYVENFSGKIFYIERKQEKLDYYYKEDFGNSSECIKQGLDRFYPDMLALYQKHHDPL